MGSPEVRYRVFAGEVKGLPLLLERSYPCARVPAWSPPVLLRVCCEGLVGR